MHGNLRSCLWDPPDLPHCRKFNRGKLGDLRGFRKKIGDKYGISKKNRGQIGDFEKKNAKNMENAQKAFKYAL